MYNRKTLIFLGSVFVLLAFFLNGGVRTLWPFGYSTEAAQAAPSQSNHYLSAITAHSKDDLWIMGFQTASKNQQQLFTEHWNGKQWRSIAGPALAGNNSLSAATAISTNDVWAVGSSSARNSEQALITHWDGKGWKTATGPKLTASSHLSGIAALSKDNIWAVGALYTSNADQPLIEHWDGNVWKAVPAPSVGNTSWLVSVAPVSANDIWAVGSSASSGKAQASLIEHWNGSTWSVVTSPNVSEQSSILRDVSVVSENDIWTVGASVNTKTKIPRALIEHWDGKNWQIVSGPEAIKEVYDLSGITALSQEHAWAVGYVLAQNSRQPKAVVIHWNGQKWQAMSGPNTGSSSILKSVLAISHDDIWAIGGFVANDVQHGLVEHWDGQSWKVVSLPNVG
jgi:hypothetical protein